MNMNMICNNDVTHLSSNYISSDFLCINAFVKQIVKVLRTIM